MTAHELAQKLLEGPDVPMCVMVDSQTEELEHIVYRGQFGYVMNQDDYEWLSK